MWPDEFLTDVSSTGDFWGDSNSEATQAVDAMGDGGAAYAGASSVPWAEGGGESNSNMEQPQEAYGPADGRSWGQRNKEIVGAAGAGLKALGSPVTRQNLDRNSGLYKYYGNRAAAAYQPAKLGVSAPAAAGQIGALKSTDPNALTNYWMGKLQSFANPQQQGRR